MGTAGPLALARDILYNDTNTPFFVLNRQAAVPLCTAIFGWLLGAAMPGSAVVPKHLTSQQRTWGCCLMLDHCPAALPSSGPPADLPRFLQRSCLQGPPVKETWWCCSCPDMITMLLSCCPMRSDVVCEYPMKEMLQRHLATGAEATILVTKASRGLCRAPHKTPRGCRNAGCSLPRGHSSRVIGTAAHLPAFSNFPLQVSDPSKYGVVVMDDNMKVERFVEKPQVRLPVPLSIALDLHEGMAGPKGGRWTNRRQALLVEAAAS